MTEQETRPCADCGVAILVTCPFTVCDECWDKLHPPKAKKRKRKDLEADRDALVARLRETEVRVERLRRVAVVVDRNVNGESVLDLIPENRELRDELAAALHYLVTGDLAPPPEERTDV